MSIVGCVIIGAVALVGAAGIMAGASVSAASQAAQAQKYAAEKNADATIQAAKEAADAQIKAARYDAKARMHENDTEYKEEMAYLKQEKWLAQTETVEQRDIHNIQSGIDAIDMSYAGEGGWGGDSSPSYDYGDA